MKESNLGKVRDYLEANKLMALATVSGDTPWIVNLFFAYDEDFNLFFFSREDTKHSKEIYQNQKVAVAIHQFGSKSWSVKGLQITGCARKIIRNEYIHCFKIYLKRYPWAVKFLKDHILYKITPKGIYYIDQELFGHFNRVRVK